MAYKLTDSQIDEILRQTDIVGLISQYLALKPRGRNYQGLCPFHSEKTPSFTVSPEKNLWHCFGCGAGGNAFHFLMKIENLNFLESAVKLAEFAGVKLKFSAVDSKTSSEREAALKILEAALIFFQKQLYDSNGQRAYNYLMQRQIKDSTVKTFKLGYSPLAGDDLYKYLLNKNLPIELAVKLGLLRQKETGSKIQDYFRNRLMFPIYDFKGALIGFGARSLDDSEPKYLNSPESFVFSKGKNLYGLDLAKTHIVKSSSCVITEGYFDVISCCQAGFKNIAAIMGTALTFDQAKLLARFAKNCILALDPDSAGLAAADKSIEIFQNAGLNIKILILPVGFDLDLYFRKRGAEAFKKLFKNSIPIMDFKIGLARKKYSLDNSEGKVNFIREVISAILKLKDKITQDEYIKKIARITKVREELIREKAALGSKSLPAEEWGKLLSKTPVIAEERLLEILFAYPDKIIQVKESFKKKDIEHLKYKEVFEVLFKSVNGLNDKPKEFFNKIFKTLEEKEALKDISKIALKEQVAFSEELFEGLIKNLKDRTLKMYLEELEKELSPRIQASEINSQDEKFQEYQKLTQYFRAKR